MTGPTIMVIVDLNEKSATRSIDWLETRVRLLAIPRSDPDTAGVKSPWVGASKSHFHPGLHRDQAGRPAESR
jgi:hypothetical protein